MNKRRKTIKTSREAFDKLLDASHDVCMHCVYTREWICKGCPLRETLMKIEVEGDDIHNT